MKANTISLLLTVALLSSGFHSYSQSYESEAVKKAKIYAAEVFKNCPYHFDSVYIASYAEWLSQVEIITDRNADLDQTYPLLSSVPLRNKCNRSLTADNAATFNPENFNPLKYMFSFYEKADQTYRVDGTSYLIVIRSRQH